MAQQQVILPGALLNADEQFIVFVDQRIHERLVIGWQQRDQKGESECSGSSSARAIWRWR